MASVSRFIRSLAGLHRTALRSNRSRTLHCSSFTFSSDVKDKVAEQPFDTQMLKVLACPLSKKPLRYDEKNNELVCDELGVAYPILSGVPHLNPQDGRRITPNSCGASSNAGDS